MLCSLHRAATLACQCSNALQRVSRPQHQTRSARERPRALGAALEIALYLARGSAGTGKPANPMHEMTTPKGRVLVITTGPTTKARNPTCLRPRLVVEGLSVQQASTLHGDA